MRVPNADAHEPSSTGRHCAGAAERFRSPRTSLARDADDPVVVCGLELGGQPGNARHPRAQRVEPGCRERLAELYPAFASDRPGYAAVGPEALDRQDQLLALVGKPLAAQPAAARGNVDDDRRGAREQGEDCRHERRRFTRREPPPAAAGLAETLHTPGPSNARPTPRREVKCCRVKRGLRDAVNETRTILG